MGIETITMKVLLTVVVTWLTLSTDVPGTYNHPKIEFSPAEQIADLRYPNVKAILRPSVLAVYHDKSRTIHLHEKWTGTTLAELSLLIHEMVHHLQNQSGLKYACPGAREAPAYAAQDRFLRLFGRDLVNEFELDPMSLKLMTSCLRL